MPRELLVHVVFIWGEWLPQFRRGLRLVILHPERNYCLFPVEENSLGLLLLCDELTLHPGLQETVSCEFIQAQSELFEQNLDLELNLVTLLARVVDFPDNLNQREHPRVLPVENLKA